MDRIDRDLLNELQFDFPLHQDSFAEIGLRLGISEDSVRERVSRLKQEGVIRYIGPLFNMSKLGFESTLAAMSVPEQDLDRVAEIISRMDCVSHNYLREDPEFNLWFTVTVPLGNIEEKLEEIKAETGIVQILDLRNEGMLKLDTRLRL